MKVDLICSVHIDGKLVQPVKSFDIEDEKFAKKLIDMKKATEVKAKTKVKKA